MRGLGNGFLSLSEILTILSIKLQKRLIVLYLFLHRTTTLPRTYPIVLSYISFLHQTTTISSMFDLPLHCLISLFYIKPQLVIFMTPTSSHCLISLFYIKPQHIVQRCGNTLIVLYLFSTSNHNSLCLVNNLLSIVLYLFSTSNHNGTLQVLLSSKLSYISFLHQTTTVIGRFPLRRYCLISLFYIKPQLRN